MAVELPMGADYETADFDDLVETVCLRGDILDMLRRQHGLPELGYGYDDYSDIRKSSLVKRLREMDEEIMRLSGNGAELPEMGEESMPQAAPAVDSRQDEIDSMARVVQELQASEVALKEQLLAREGELEQVGCKCTQLEAELQVLRDALEQAPDAEELRKLQQEIQSLRTENGELTKKLSVKKGALTKEKNKVAQLEEELNRLKQQVHDSPSSEEYETLKTECLSLGEKLDAAEKAKLQLETELAEQKRLVDELKRKQTEVMAVPSGPKDVKKPEAQANSYSTITGTAQAPEPKATEVSSLFSETPKPAQPTANSAATKPQKGSGSGMLGIAFQ